MERREFLKFGAMGAGAAALSPVAGACAPTDPPVSGPYGQGIASGLHSPTQVVLWTRVDPRVSSAATVAWSVATDAAMSSVVASGNAAITGANDHCVKVLAGGLNPGTEYWYRFTVDSIDSAIGHTKTLPASGASVSSLKLAFASCQHFSAGYYSAWRQIAQQDLDAVMFLGDYIYEIGVGPLGVRWEPFTVAQTADDYRIRYRTYKSDPDLQAAHAAHAWTVIWDDHELWNDHDSVIIAEQQARADAAHATWFLYQPVWPENGFQIYRSFRWGNLAEMTMLDTRQYRGEHLPDGLLGTDMTDDLASATRSILGSTQRQWLFDTLDDAEADGVAWKILGNQVMIAPIRFTDLDTPAARAVNPGLVKHAGTYTDMDGWSGFSSERDVVLSHIADSAVSDVVVLTGDYHAFFQADVRKDYDDDSTPHVLTEFVVSSISSATFNLPEAVNAAANGGQVTSFPPLGYSNLDQNGWGLCEVTPTALSVTFYGHLAAQNATPAPIAKWRVDPGSSVAVRLPL